MKTLVFNATPENLDLARKHETMGFTGRSSPNGKSRFGEDSWASEPEIGDRAVLYAIRVGIVGVVEVTSTLYRSSAPIWANGLYPYRVTFRVVQWFDEVLPLPRGLHDSAVTRHNPRLLTEEEADAMARGIGEALLGLEAVATAEA
jgi:hypothetical protein